MKTDAQLKQDILAELSWDPAIRSTDVGVIVKDGVVTLTGHLAHYPEKAAVEHAVQRVSGVRAIAIEMDVQLEPGLARNDSDIAASAEHALQWSVLVPSGRIQLMVEKGWLTLRGEVEWDYQRRAAEKAVSDLLGVIGVTNLVKVKPSVRSALVEKNVHDALARQAERAAKSVKISIDGSTVTLRGSVHSWAERAAVQGAAWSAPGVSTVLNELTVDP